MNAKNIIKHNYHKVSDNRQVCVCHSGQVQPVVYIRWVRFVLGIVPVQKTEEEKLQRNLQPYSNPIREVIHKKKNESMDFV